MVEEYTSGVGVAATRRDKAAMIVEDTAVNRMFAILTFSFIRASFYPLFRVHCSHIIVISKIADSIQSSELGPNSHHSKPITSHEHLSEGCCST